MIPFLSLPLSVRQRIDDMDAAALRRPASVVRSQEDRGLHDLQDNGGGKLEPEDGEEEIAWERQGGSVWPEHACRRLPQPRRN